MPRYTPIASECAAGHGDDCTVELPDGWSRVWCGHVLPGDRYLHGSPETPGRVADGRIVDPDWRTITFADLLGNGTVVYDDNPYDHCCVYACVIRERSTDCGKPCPKCGIRPRDPWEDECGVCDLPEEILDAAPELFPPI